MPLAALGMRSVQSISPPPPPPPVPDEPPTPPSSSRQHMHVNISESAVLEVFQQKFNKLFEQWQKVEEETINAECSGSSESRTLVTRLQGEFRLQLQFFLDNFKQVSNDDDRIRMLCLYFEEKARCRFELLFKLMKDEEKQREGAEGLRDIEVIDLSEPTVLTTPASPELIAEKVRSPTQREGFGVTDVIQVSEPSLLTAAGSPELIAEKVKSPTQGEGFSVTDVIEVVEPSLLTAAGSPELIAEKFESPTQWEGFSVTDVIEVAEPSLLTAAGSPQLIAEKFKSPTQGEGFSVTDVIEVAEPSLLTAAGSPQLIAEKVKSPTQGEGFSVTDVIEVAEPSLLTAAGSPVLIAEKVKSQREDLSIIDISEDSERPSLAGTPPPEILIVEENLTEKDLVIIWESSPSGHSSQTSPPKRKRPVRTPLKKIDNDLIILKSGMGSLRHIKVSPQKRKPRNSKRKALCSPVKIYELKPCKVVILRDRNLDERAEIREILLKSQMAEIQLNKVESKLDVSENDGVSGQTGSNITETSDFEFSGNESTLPQHVTVNEEKDQEETDLSDSSMTDQDQMSDVYHPSSTDASLFQASISSAYETGSEYVDETDDESLFSVYTPSPRQRACKNCPYRLRPSPSKPIRFFC